MTKEQLKNYSELIKHLYEQGHIMADGDVWLGDELVIDVDDTSSDYGFIGKPNDLMARKHLEAEAILKEWSQSPDPFRRQAASLCPRMFVFIDDQEMWDGMTEEQEALIRHNHKWTLRVSGDANRAMPMSDLSYTKIDGVRFLNCGNFNFPWTEGRAEWLADNLTVSKWVQFILDDLYDELAFGGLGLG